MDVAYMKISEKKRKKGKRCRCCRYPSAPNQTRQDRPEADCRLDGAHFIPAGMRGVDMYAFDQSPYSPLSPPVCQAYLPSPSFLKQHAFESLSIVRPNGRLPVQWTGRKENREKSPLFEIRCLPRTDASPILKCHRLRVQLTP